MKNNYNIEYVNDVSKIDPSLLNGFFIGWPNPPTNKTLLSILNKSYRSIVAFDDNKPIGFITAISDGVLSAYIPLLEVLPEYQSKGVGGELVKRMKQKLSHLYMIDLQCDEDLISFYEKFEMRKATGVSIRNYKRQNGAS